MLFTLLPYLTVAANLLLVLGVLMGVSQSVRRLRRRLSALEAARETESARVSTALQELKSKIQQVEEKEMTPPNGVSDAGGITLDSALRSRALKMHRLGQPVKSIAGALRVPKGEVDLLVKVHQIVMLPYEEDAALGSEKR